MADDSISARISADCPAETQQVLTAAWAHDVAAVKKLLNTPGRASCQDARTRETPLHAAIRACGEPSDDDTPEDLTAARDTVHELLLWGAIWNDVDDRDETPGCLALRLRRPDLYGLCVDAGVRAEMLFGLLGGYEELDGGEEETEGEEDTVEMDVVVAEAEDGQVVQGTAKAENGVARNDEEVPELVTIGDNTVQNGNELLEPPLAPPTEDDHEKRHEAIHPDASEQAAVTSEGFLRSHLTYTDGKLVDDDGNGVMMAWETDIMRRSVDALLRSRSSSPNGDANTADQPAQPPGPEPEPGKRILNIGFGMGIIDSMFAAATPSRHHIIEAHPEVLAHMDRAGEEGASHSFGAAWEARGPEPGAFRVHRGRWQDVAPALVRAREEYDAIYFDTFGEDYSQLRLFFTEHVPALLAPGGAFGFFNGLGADRQVCYDVYAKVAEMHLADAGLDVEWQLVDVDMAGLGEQGKDGWEGVRRRYWTLDKYRLPICTFMDV